MAAAEAAERYKDADWLEDRYHGDGATAADLAEECGVTPSNISYWLHKLDVGTRGPGTPVQEGAVHQDADWLRERYWGDGMSIPDLADEAGVSQTTIVKWMHRRGVETRPQPEAAARPRIPAGELRADVERVAEGLGRRPSTAEYEDLGEHSYQTVIARWGGGSWPRALDELGI